jgi:hypothetical protein
MAVLFIAFSLIVVMSVLLVASVALVLRLVPPGNRLRGPVLVWPAEKMVAVLQEDEDGGSVRTVSR